MSDCEPARNPSLPEAIRRILLVLLAAFWWFRFEQPTGAALLSSPLIDAGLIGVLAFWGHRRGLAWQDGLLWLILSRRLHLDAYEGLEALQPLVQIAWLVLAAAWASVTTERGRFLLVVYHAGLTFDAGMARSFGLGMSVGWEAAPLTLLFLAAALRRVVLRGGEARFPAGAVPVFLGMLAVVGIHRLGPAGHLTCAVTATVAAAMLFLATAPRDGSDGAEELAVLALGGIPLCLAALQLGIADAPDIAVFLRKRLSAGGLHPNLIAA
ncbi:MAG TPA: hypothetical protein PLP29_19925, partial [Candidatus Ozemobacteraceae bacterium]|nr:hypothetical protein [Candidatus Ozemobacteraceae bacterium]